MIVTIEFDEDLKDLYNLQGDRGQNFRVEATLLQMSRRLTNIEKLLTPKPTDPPAIEPTIK